MARGFPDRVPAWYTSPAGAIRSMISALPPNAPTGRPPPITLPSVVKSGSTPCAAWAPPRWTRNPVITSSKMSTLPASAVISRSVARKARRRGDAAHVAGDRFDDDGRDVLAHAGKDLSHGIDIVERCGQGVLGRIGRHARGVGQVPGSAAPSRRRRAGRPHGRGSSLGISRSCRGSSPRARGGSPTWSPRCPS